MLYLNEEFTRIFRGADPFDRLQSMDGKIYREVKGRKTLQFSLEGRSYFVKMHFGVGWREVFKNLLQLRMPILGAENEWRAIAKLEALDVATMKSVAYGSRGWNPVKRQSFIVTEDLSQTISLEDHCADWGKTKPKFQEKKQLIEKLAHISRTLHEGGVCHRDFYLCHFLLHLEQSPTGAAVDEESKLSLIDLHRALIKKNLGKRWKLKDISGLYYSAMDTGLTQRDLLRFIKHYNGMDLRRCLTEKIDFWRAVEHRARSMYERLGSANIAP